ncbi:hypothetical protein [Arthrobacter sp. ISL-72]|uniref:hypothetical protein n=1 Tax=Arthrobacter sp. ISL-72 TaxID=2819114 RepID=UPI001BE51167|nr:hypothetical protein [Arthrobacter sp. ISL-72]MBT2596613.1 hypothetical protein [Arthrobacter sp. ISL-72]
MSNDQQPGVPQQPEHNGWQQPSQQNHQGQQGFEQPPYPPRADQYNFGQQPYGEPGQYSQPDPAQYGQTPPKRGIPVWGWVAGGVGGAAVLAVAGVMVLGGIGSAKAREVVPAPTETAASSETAGSSQSAEAEEATTDDSSAAPMDEAIYLFEEADFTAPPVWSTAIPDGWTVSDAKGGTIQYRSSDNPCLFTTHQAILPPTEALTDEIATMATMQSEIEGVKASAGSAVTVVTDADSHYTKLRNPDGHGIELQEAELRFKNRSDVDLVYRIAVRSMPAADGLMELTLACPANLPTELELWSDLSDSVTMKDDPAAGAAG